MVRKPGRPNRPFLARGQSILNSVSCSSGVDGAYPIEQGVRVGVAASIIVRAMYTRCARPRVFAHAHAFINQCRHKRARCTAYTDSADSVLGHSVYTEHCRSDRRQRCWTRRPTQCDSAQCWRAVHDGQRNARRNPKGVLNVQLGLDPRCRLPIADVSMPHGASVVSHSVSTGRGPGGLEREGVI